VVYLLHLPDKMKLIRDPSGQLVRRLQRQGLAGYMRVGLATPWVNMEAALDCIHVDDMNPVAVRHFLTYQTEAS
jgi:hypothetical protein